MIFRLLLPLLLLVSTLSVASVTQPPTTPPPVWEVETPTLPQVETSTTAVNKELEEISKEVADSSPDGQRRTLLKHRLEQLLELGELLERMKALDIPAATIQAEEKEIAKEIARQNALPPPTLPEKPTPDGITHTKDQLEKAARELDVVTTEAKDRQEMLQQLPNLMKKAREDRKSAQEEATKFQELVTKAEGNTRKLLTTQVANAHMQVILAETRQKRYEKEQEYEKRVITLRDSKLELARLRHQYMEQTVLLYQKAMEKELTATLKNVEDTLTVKEQAAAEASSPTERFVADWEAAIARNQKNIADINIIKNELITNISEQERQLKAENDELKNLENLSKQYGNRVNAAEMLQETFRRVGVRRLSLKEVIPVELKQRIAALHSRTFSIDSQLFSLRDRWREEVVGVVGSLADKQKTAFDKKAETLLETYRRGLLEEKRLLVEVDTERQRLDMLPMERARVLDDLEAFVFSRVFWVQDAPPLGFDLGHQLFKELFSTDHPYSILNWWMLALSDATSMKLAQVFGSPLAMAYGFLFFLILPGLLIHIRGRLRRFYEARREMVADRKTSLHRRLAPVIAALAGVLLTPIYLLAVAYGVEGLSLPAAIGTLVEQVLRHFAFFWLLWLANRLIFGQPGVAHHLLGVPESIATALLRSLRMVLLAYLVCLLPWMIFRVDPFLFEAVPRMGFTLFELAVSWAIYLLIRPSSPLVTLAFRINQGQPAESVSQGFFTRYWGTISHLVTFFMIIVVMLDMAGYRFGAMHLARNGLLTLVTVFVMTALHQTSAGMLERVILRRRRNLTTVAPGTRSLESRSEIVEQIRNSLRLLFILAGALLLANYWGINQRALETLNSYTLYSTTLGDKLEVVTLADLAKFILSLTIIYWLLKHLPKIYELLIFPHMELDAGLRYALVTISRYLIFLVGFFMALSFLRLDLSKVGWLAAAISVGIGFGLQEIVANFVSGIILLVERPIRVGDIITVGGASGKVTRINIRSTTILNFDSQELLIPNRDLITKEVTNWTLGNTNTRLVIPIGVAYGSDVDVVRNTLLELADAQPEVLKDPPTEAWFLCHGASSLDFELRVFLPSPTLRMKVLDRLNTLINKKFKEMGIEIPFNQQELHIRSWPFFGAGGDETKAP